MSATSPSEVSKFAPLCPPPATGHQCRTAWGAPPDPLVTSSSLLCVPELELSGLPQGTGFPLASSTVWPVGALAGIRGREDRDVGESRPPPSCLAAELSPSPSWEPPPVPHAFGPGLAVQLRCYSLPVLFFVVSLHPEHGLINSLFIKLSSSYPSLNVPSVLCQDPN